MSRSDPGKNNPKIIQPRHRYVLIFSAAGYRLIVSQLNETFRLQTFTGDYNRAPAMATIK